MRLPLKIRDPQRQTPTVRFPARTLSLVCTLLLFVYFIADRIWIHTHRCESIDAYWLGFPFPLLWMFAFAFLLLLHWVVIAWACALLCGASRWSDHAVFVSLLGVLLLVGGSLLKIWELAEHERLYLSGIRFGIEREVTQWDSIFGSDHAFQGWARCAVDRYWSRSGDEPLGLR